MTVLVGVLCEDGVVIGADSSTTFTDGRGARTIEQIAPGKIAVVADRVIVAGTGAVGHAQRFVHIVEKKCESPANFTPHPLDIARELSSAARQNFAFTKSPKGLFGAL